MNKAFPYFRFVRDSLLNGIGMLLVITPASAAYFERQESSENIGFGRHFEPVGDYLRSAITTEAPKLIADLEQLESKQLELEIRI